jgi:competence ComEA-like helix-hairpin-helix protein
MRKSHKFLAITLLMLSLGTPAIFADDQASEAVGGVININTADAAQFALLPRLGVKAGERIVAYREEHGPFKKVTDLMQVKGIGDKTFQLISPYLVLEGKSTLSEAVRTPRKPRTKKASTTAQ